MTREEMLSKIIELVDPLDPIEESTVISECDDIDSLALFNLVVYFKSIVKKCSLVDLSKCVTVSDFIDLALN